MPFKKNREKKEKNFLFPLHPFKIFFFFGGGGLGAEKVQCNVEKGCAFKMLAISAPCVQDLTNAIIIN